MKKGVRRAVLIAGTSLAGLTLQVGAAHAEFASQADFGVYDDVGPDGYTLTWDCVETYRTKACFQVYGDKIWVFDKVSDRYTPQAFWQRQNTDGSVAASGVCENHHGAGTWAVCNKDLMENRYVKIRAESQNYNTGTDGASSDWLRILNEN